MNLMVEFHLPPNLPRAEASYIAVSSVGLWIVIGQDKQPKAIVKDFALKPQSILFRIDVLDEELMDVINTGDPDESFIWINPIEGMLGLPN
jgi:hypothetical protein